MEEGKVNHSRILAGKPHEEFQRTKNLTPEDEPPRSEDVHYAMGEKWRAITNSSRKNEVAGQRGNDARLWMSLVVKVKSEVVKNNMA